MPQKQKCGSGSHFSSGSSGAASLPFCKSSAACLQDSMRNLLKSRIPHKKVLLSIGIILAGIAGSLLLCFGYPVARKFFPTCPFYQLLHLYCPGCGSTRATFYLLNGDIPGVFRSNPIYLPTIFLLLFILVSKNKTVRPLILKIWIAIIILFWICRNLPWYPFTYLAPAELPF